jgi:hypothetical protein
MREIALGIAKLSGRLSEAIDFMGQTIRTATAAGGHPSLDAVLLAVCARQPGDPHSRDSFGGCCDQRSSSVGPEKRRKVEAVMASSPSQGAPKPLWFLDDLAYVHVDGEQTGDALSVVELAGRRADLPPLHVDHRNMRPFTSSQAE